MWQSYAASRERAHGVGTLKGQSNPRGNTMSLLFSFFGRCGRGGYWLGVLVNLLLVAAALALAYFIFGAPMAMLNADGTPVPFGDQPPPDAKMVFNPGALAIIGVGYVLAVWIGLATAIKRLHDRGKSGWWLLLMVLLSFIVIGSIWILVELGILEGQQGPNKYGPDPRAA